MSLLTSTHALDLRTKRLDYYNLCRWGEERWYLGVSSRVPKYVRYCEKSNRKITLIMLKVIRYVSINVISVYYNKYMVPRLSSSVHFLGRFGSRISCKHCSNI